MNENEIREALKAVKYPGYSRDIVSFGLVKEIAASNGAATVVIQLTSGSREMAQQIKEEAERVLRALPGIKMAYVDVRLQPGAPVTTTPSPWGQQQPLPGIQKIIAVASGEKTKSELAGIGDEEFAPWQLGPTF